MTTRVTSCSRVTRKSSDNIIWRQVYTIQQMAHAVSCFDSDLQSQTDPINEGGTTNTPNVTLVHCDIAIDFCLVTSLLGKRIL